VLLDLDEYFGNSLRNRKIDTRNAYKYFVGKSEGIYALKSDDRMQMLELQNKIPEART
jgi:hypothetical protein